MLTATRKINQRTDQVQLHVAPEVTDAGAIMTAALQAAASERRAVTA